MRHISIYVISLFGKKTISSDAQFSWHREYTSHMIYPSFLIEENEKYWKTCSASQFMQFLFWEKTISSDAQFSWHQEYPSHMIHPSFLIEENEKYWKKCGASQFMSFLFLENKLSHLVHNFLGIKNILVT